MHPPVTWVKENGILGPQQEADTSANTARDDLLQLHDPSPVGTG